MRNLHTKKCVPCEGGVPPLASEEIRKLSSQIPGWSILDGKKIRRELQFKNFKQAVEFVDKVAELAEREGHHPDIWIYSWNKVRLELSTHAIGGLSENDFILAAKISVLKYA